MNDDEFRQALAALDMYQAQLESLARQAQIFQVSLEESIRARETAKAFLNAKEGDELLIPIGAASFVTAKATGENRAIVGIGSRMSVEKDLNGAVAFLEENVREITEALKKSTEAISEMETNARNLSAAVQQEYQRRQQ
ncbi:MAG: prefoldin subunit alpha [Methanomassiliicoccaceae archaeon]|jgi:prefoldin alpha subunit|nr:prefoldin subunit alpha [Methanomassiliicoccaceae archaeon]